MSKLIKQAETIKDLHLRTLTRGYWLGAGLTLLGMIVVLGFQLYYTLGKGLPASLSILTAVAIVSITVMLPHLMSAMALMGKNARVSGTVIIAIIAGAALVASYHHMNQLFLSTGYSWTAAYLLPLAFDGTAVLGLIFAFGAASKKTRIQFGLDEYNDQDRDERVKNGLSSSEENTQDSETKITVTETKPTKKVKGIKSSATVRGTKEIESGEIALSENEMKWLPLVQEVYEEGMSVNKVKEALKARYDKSGNHNTITKLVRVVREGKV